MSKELLSKFNQVLRPYYAQMTRPGIGDNAALQDFLARFSADHSLFELLAATSPEVKELQELVSGNNAVILIHFLKARLFQQQIAPALAVTLLQQAPSSELEAIGQALQEKAKISLESTGQLFDVNQLSHILCLLLASYIEENLQQAGIEHAMALPAAGSVAVDANPDEISAQLFAPCKLKKLYCVAARPNAISELTRNSSLASCAKEVVILKTIMHSMTGSKIFFDQSGNAYANRIPAGNSANNFFLTRSFAALLKDTKASTIKFTLQPEVLTLFTGSENTKFLNKNEVNVLACFTGGESAGTAFNLKQEFADCAQLAAFLRFMQGLKHQYSLQFQFDANNYNRLLIACSLTANK